MEPGHDPRISNLRRLLTPTAVETLRPQWRRMPNLCRKGVRLPRLAEKYLRGEGVQADFQVGLELRRVAAAQESMAAFNRGLLHRSGDFGVPVDTAESKRYLCPFTAHTDSQHSPAFLAARRRWA